ncbi:hypothetical protein D3C76_1534800 [compost metagenome]
MPFSATGVSWKQVPLPQALCSTAALAWAAAPAREKAMAVKKRDTLFMMSFLIQLN